MILEKIYKGMGDLDSIKIYTANGIAWLSTLTTIDTSLKRALLVASLVYTLVKIWKLIMKKEDPKD